MKQGRTTVYNYITSEEKLKQVNKVNIELEEDFVEYLSSTDRAKTTIGQYQHALHILWCWNLDYNNNIPFVDFTKRQITRFQNHALNEWGWSPARIRTVKATFRSLENFILNILDDEYPDYKKIWDKIESPANEPVREKSIFTTEELQGLLDYLVENKEYLKACYLALAMYSGRRKSELARFKVSYFTDDNLICNGALYKTPEKITTKGRGSKGKLLYVYTLAKPFKPYLDLWMAERDRLGIKSEWLFPKCKNGVWSDEQIPISAFNSFSETFSRYLGKPMYAHSLRHKFVSDLLEQNLPEAVVQSMIGWSSRDMVSVYDDRSNESQLEKYFGEEGVKNISSVSLEDL